MWFLKLNENQSLQLSAPFPLTSYVKPVHPSVHLFSAYLGQGYRIAFLPACPGETKSFPGQLRATWLRREILSIKTKNRIIVTDSFSFEQTVMKNFRMSSFTFYVLLSFSLSMLLFCLFIPSTDANLIVVLLKWSSVFPLLP